ncbi:unnamed protein product [Trifolium pratense]|uniref:Uncharacterized protein n=1 Tax=Trifolium pratense TaxID=57577 RepID=A0ACB0LHX5_TRIPR|nr:unnamed protein product [Trifolium pratense]
MDNQNDFSGTVTNINIKAKQSMDRKTYMVSSRVVFLENEEEDINMKADTFITNFRKQLKIERQESLQRFHQKTRRSA